MPTSKHALCNAPKIWWNAARGHLLLFCLIAISFLSTRYCFAYGGTRAYQEDFRARYQFAKRMAGIRRDMSKEQVRQLLGEPDLIQAGPHPWEHRHNKGQVLWLYGTQGAVGFASLGEVEFSPGGTVNGWFGHSDTPPRTRLISEKELRSTLGAIYHFDVTDDGPELSGFTFNPLALIQITNRLHGLGKDKALAVLHEYYRVSPTFSQKVLLILRTLFEVPKDPGYFPPLPLGRTKPEEPLDGRLVPRFPLILLDDVPLLIYQEADFSELRSNELYPPAKAQIEYLKKRGIFRKRALQPTHRPLDLLEKLVSSGQWLFAREYPTEYDTVAKAYSAGGEQYARIMIMAQLVRLVRSVYPQWVEWRADRDVPRLPNETRLQQWEKARDYLNSIRIVWDGSKNDYIRSPAL